MAENHVVPTKEQIVTLLRSIQASPNLLPAKTIGDLIGMKLVDSLLPKMPIEPEWGYEGLVAFCTNNGLENTDTIENALKKLN